MQEFTPDTLRRIFAVVETVEKMQHRQSRGPDVPGLLPPTFRAFKLTADLAAGGTAAANLMKWNGSAYVEDTGTSFTVTDTLGNCKASTGDVGLTRALAGDSGVVWEVIRSGAEVSNADEEEPETETLDVITSLQVDVGNKELELKTTTITVIAKEPEDEDWTVWHTGKDCP